MRCLFSCLLFDSAAGRCLFGRVTKCGGFRAAALDLLGLQALLFSARGGLLLPQCGQIRFCQGRGIGIFVCLLLPGWLRRILKGQGIERDQDVLIALLDTQGELLVQEKGKNGRMIRVQAMPAGEVRW